ncbi:hypothetical protein Pan161_21770 [Gimesia algae]|uniref:Uncharacterized protein n=1 Tax=Gimesia algae TaxID=2527971 RepID=A0A517VBZ3_9PLAN|nr:hypothetical protein Pan161_21770 [Gimesia algae]
MIAEFHFNSLQSGVEDPSITGYQPLNTPKLATHYTDRQEQNLIPHLFTDN